uniref:PH domain-containing protein n=1 Tax=Anopheles stephensi TaxID=30069 RepID=A0A182Y0Y6_ANOST
MAMMLEGTLSKWTNVMKGWQYRWFVLDENAGLLSYYTEEQILSVGLCVVRCMNFICHNPSPAVLKSER